MTATDWKELPLGNGWSREYGFGYSATVVKEEELLVCTILVEGIRVRCFWTELPSEGKEILDLLVESALASPIFSF